MRLIKRLLASALIFVGLTFILLGIASAIGVIVVIACPFVALAQGMAYWEASKGGLL
jgi:predicted histidine transporter YuiF (NhaC family)